MNQLTYTYRLKIIGREGMYTSGDLAETPELAKLNKGVLRQDVRDRLAIVRSTYDGSRWTDSGGNTHLRSLQDVVVDCELEPRTWAI